MIFFGFSSHLSWLVWQSHLMLPLRFVFSSFTTIWQILLSVDILLLHSVIPGLRELLWSGGQLSYCREMLMKATCLVLPGFVIFLTVVCVFGLVRPTLACRPLVHDNGECLIDSYSLFWPAYLSNRRCGTTIFNVGSWGHCNSRFNPDSIECSGIVGKHRF